MLLEEGGQKTPSMAGEKTGYSGRFPRPGPYQRDLDSQPRQGKANPDPFSFVILPPVA